MLDRYFISGHEHIFGPGMSVHDCIVYTFFLICGKATTRYVPLGLC
jgi:hypothetical protein